MRYSRRTHFEEIYLLWHRLSKSITPESESFLKSKDTQKIVRYMANKAFMKYRSGLKFLGLEADDLRQVAQCYALIYFHHYLKDEDTPKRQSGNLMAFIGQKLHYYVRISHKKHQDSERNPTREEIFLHPDVKFVAVASRTNTVSRLEGRTMLVDERDETFKFFEKVTQATKKQFKAAKKTLERPSLEEGAKAILDVLKMA